jgi:HEAT repeat protein
MWRFLSLSLLVPLVLLAPSTARAADDEPSLQGKKLSEWIVLLRGDKAQTDRQTLLHALGCSASHPEAWKSQIRLREAGVIAVAIIGPQKSRDVFPALLGALRNDADESIRRLAAYHLGRLGAKVHEDNTEKPSMAIKLDDVAALSNDKSPKVREASARSLGQLKEDAKEAVPKLVAALQDPHEGTQAAAAEALRILGKSLYVRDALPQLEAALKNPKTNTIARVQIVITMGIIGPEANAKVLGDVLKDPAAPNELRIAVAETLGQLVKLDSVADLKAVLAVKDGTPLELRRACVAALDKFGPDAKPALEELMKGMHDKDKYMRTLSMHAIGRIGKYLGSDSKAVVKDLLTICNDPILEVRIAAIETLGNLGADAIGDDLPAVQNKLTELGKDSQRGVRDAAADAMKKLKPAP